MLWPAPLPRPVAVVGFPSTAYHWRSTAVSGTPVLLQTNVAPWSSERAVLKFASVRSLKYRCPALSTPSSVSPPPAHGGGLPGSGAAERTHLNGFPPARDRQNQL